MLFSASNATSPRRAGPRRLAGLCAFVLAVSGYALPARAEFFQFATTVTILNGLMPPEPPALVTNNNTATVTINADPLTTNAAVITVSGDASASPFDNFDATGFGTDIVFGRIDVAVTNAPPATPFLNGVVIPYVFHVVVIDYASYNSNLAVDSKTFDIKGVVTGTIGPGKKVNLSTNTYDPGNVLSKIIGTEVYTLDLNFYVPPGPSNAGAFGVHVTATPVPEPGTIALFGLGMLVLATPAYRRWRRKSQR